MGLNKSVGEGTNGVSTIAYKIIDGIIIIDWSSIEMTHGDVIISSTEL